MSRPLYRPMRTDDPLLYDLQGRITNAMAEAQTGPLAGAQLLGGPNSKPLTLSAGLNRIGHGLGMPVRWVLVSPSANAVVWEDPTDEQYPDRILSVRASASLNCFLLLFPR